MSDAHPVRVQLSRQKGWRMPPNTVIVARPSFWGNPFRVGYWNEEKGRHLDSASAVALFRKALRKGHGLEFNLTDIQSELRGKNLACWCKTGSPCHADILLEIANA